MKEFTADAAIKAIRMFPKDFQKRVWFGARAFAPLIKGDEMEMLILVNESHLEIALNYKYVDLNNVQALPQLIGQVNKPMRLTVLDVLSKIFDIEIKQYSQALLVAWISTEFPHQLSTRQLIALFKRADCTYMMNEEDKEVYGSLPDEITVYRGAQHKNAKVRGCSWTLNEKRAIWFARRWTLYGGETGKLYRATIRKDRVFLYTNGRGEEEIVLNPFSLRNVEEIELPPLKE